MLIKYDLNKLPLLPSPIGLSIGMFDGLHLGHKYLFKTMKKKTKSHVVLTFFSSPEALLNKKRNFSSLMSLDLKLKLLKEENFDLILALAFSEKIKQMPYDKFLHFLRKKIPFSHLFLGEDATLGKNKEGNKKNLAKFARENSFSFTALQLRKFEKLPITSSRIRKEILMGDLQKAKKMLGRDILYLLTSFKEKNGFCYFFEKTLCLPPSGLYPTAIKKENIIFPSYIEIDQNKKCIKIKKSFVDEKKLTFPLFITLC